MAAGGEADPVAAQEAPKAARASRTNTLFSIPMLFFMGSASHWNLVRAEDPGYGVFYLISLALIILFELSIWVGTPWQKPLGSVSGTITSGFVLTAILVGVGLALL